MKNKIKQLAVEALQRDVGDRAAHLRVDRLVDAAGPPDDPNKKLPIGFLINYKMNILKT